jgi:hypothetical protein
MGTSDLLEPEVDSIVAEFVAETDRTTAAGTTSELIRLVVEGC